MGTNAVHTMYNSERLENFNSHLPGDWTHKFGLDWTWLRVLLGAGTTLLLPAP